MDQFSSYIYSKIEDTHWWFLGRNDILSGVLQRALRHRNSLKILDIGCGSGTFLIELQKYGDVWGIDMSKEALRFASTKGKFNLLAAHFPKEVPFRSSSFDLITSLDVLEHIGSDELFLKSVFELLKDNGLFICTVPALPILWSSHDEICGHKRRYTRRSLKEKLIQVGFEKVRVSYFEFFLFIPVTLIRLLSRLGVKKTEFDFPNLPSFLNSCLRFLLGLEKYRLWRANFPIGICMMAFARKH